MSTYSATLDAVGRAEGQDNGQAHETLTPSSIPKPKRRRTREKGSGKTNRINRTSEEIAALRSALIELVHDHGEPTTVRHIYYLAVSHGLGPKGDTFYQDVILRMTEARRRGELEWSRIVDNTREIDEPLTFTGIQQAQVCELDAMEPDDLRAMVEAAIVQHIKPTVYNAMRQREAKQKETLLNLATHFEEGAA